VDPFTLLGPTAIQLAERVRAEHHVPAGHVPVDAEDHDWNEVKAQVSSTQSRRYA
jgi:hypothetical protein